jgi:hypothetical protein
MADAHGPGWQYDATLSLLHQAEATTWARLRGYLVLAGFVASGIVWGALKGQLLVVFLLSAGGAYLSWVFYALIFRSRAFVTRYEDYARRLEEGSGPLSDGAELAEELKETHPRGSGVVAPSVPMVAGVLMFAMAVASILTGIADTARGVDHAAALRSCVAGFSVTQGNSSPAPKKGGHRR